MTAIIKNAITELWENPSIDNAIFESPARLSNALSDVIEDKKIKYLLKIAINDLNAYQRIQNDGDSLLMRKLITEMMSTYSVEPQKAVDVMSAIAEFIAGYEGDLSATGSAASDEDLHYEGDLLDGAMHGNGRLVTAEGLVLEGVFAHGKLIKGKMSDKTGFTMEGTFSDFAKLHGQGRVTLTDGRIIEGEFVHGEPVDRSMLKESQQESQQDSDFYVIKERNADCTLYMGQVPNADYVMLGIYADGTVIGIEPSVQNIQDADGYAKQLGAWFKRENIEEDKGWFGKKEIKQNQGPYGETILLGQVSPKAELVTKLTEAFFFDVGYQKNGYIFMIKGWNGMALRMDVSVMMNGVIHPTIPQKLDQIFAYIGYVKNGQVFLAS